MSSFNEVAKATNSSVYDELGLNKKPKSSFENSNQVLGQDDFLKLMTTQLQNQDPFSPMENGDFIAQMAQFSTVTGIDQVNESLQGLSNQYAQGRIATAVNLLGHSVLVPSAVAKLDEDGVIHGVLELPEPSTSTSVNFYDLKTDELLHTLDLGPTAAGTVGFSWDEIPTELIDNKTTFRLEAKASFASGEFELKPSVYAAVMSVSNDMIDQRVELTTSTEDKFELSEITKFK